MYFWYFEWAISNCRKTSLFSIITKLLCEISNYIIHFYNTSIITITPRYTVTAEGKIKIYDSKFPWIVEEGGIYLYQNYRNSLSALLRWENEKEKTGGAQFSSHFRYFDCFYYRTYETIWNNIFQNSTLENMKIMKGNICC